MTGGAARQKTDGGAMPKVTPMFAQYLAIKAQVGDAVLFFRLGDFYEMFFEDAERVAPLLDLTLTSRNKDAPNPIPMCGVPVHAAQGYMSRLVQLGLKVAICDQVGDPQASPGLVERGLTRVITAGTVLDEEEGLAATSPGYLTALSASEGGDVAIVSIDVSTGEVRACLASAPAAREEIARIAPREVLVPEGDAHLRALAPPQVTTTERDRPQAHGASAPPTGLPDSGPDPAIASALAMATRYLEETVRGGLAHLRPIEVYALADRLLVDERTRRNLDLLTGPDGSRHGSLWWALDATSTAMGSRCLRGWLVHPSVDLARIGERLDAVETLVDAPGLRAELRDAIAPAGDLERLVGRIALGRGGPREIGRLGRSLGCAERVVTRLSGESLPALLGALAKASEPPAELARSIADLLAESLPIQASEGGLVRQGADGEVDRLRSLKQDAQALLAALEAKERAATGISSLRIRYQRVFGYFFEITKANLKLVPVHFTRRQTLASGERFTSPELLELERELASADDLCRKRELELFEGLLDTVRAHEARLTSLAHALAQLDALVSLAEVAHAHGYVRPRLHRGTRLQIRDGRHPVVERTSASGRFVPNDVLLDDEAEQIAIVTGPNMAGKSTYLRQVALIVLLAHAGSFVPAADAEIPLTDRIWTRVGAGDDLVAGDSTFMVEMKETAAILGNLSARSLVVLDEIGRGTSTYDGIAIAWAVAEYLHDLVPAPGARVKTLFATHFHELTALGERLPRIRNLSVAVREWKDDVLFLRKVVAGPASRSYGVAVARLAGVPEPVVRRARELLASLEAGRPLGGGPARGRRGDATQGNGSESQLSLFSAHAENLRQELLAIDVERLTPLDALARLHALVEKAKRP